MADHGYLAMILTSVPCIMICHNLDKCTMVNHDLARLTIIMASVPWLRTLGIHNKLASRISRTPENLTYQTASGNLVPKIVLNASRVIKVTQTTKKHERETIIENQPSFRCILKIIASTYIFSNRTPNGCF